MKIGKLLVAIVVFMIAGPFCIQAQISPDLEQGIKSYGSYEGGNLDHISMSNGNLFFRANLTMYSQRGGKLAYPIVLQYNNENFSLLQVPAVCPPGTKPGQTGCAQHVVFGPPWNFTVNSAGNSVTPLFAGGPVQKATGAAGPGLNTSLSFDGNPIYVQLYSLVTADGSLHALANTTAGNVVLDGSEYATNGSLLDGQGTKFSNNVIEDANGNQINPGTAGTASVAEDTVGRMIPPLPAPGAASTASLSACPALNYSFQPVTAAYAWNPPTVGGGTLPLVLCYASVVVRTGTANGPGWYDVNQAFNMLQSVVFPDNTYWAFQYDAADPNTSTSDALGDLLKVTFPTGGSIAYTWDTRGNAAPMSRSVSTRTVDANDGTGPHTWQYSYSLLSFSNGNPQIPSMTVTVTDPLNNQTVHTMTGLGGFLSLYETQTRYFQGTQSSGTLLRTVNTDYQFTPNVWDNGYVGSGGAAQDASSVTNIFPIRVTTTLPNGLVSKVETDYDTGLTYHGPLDGITSNIKNCNPDGCQYQDQTTNPVSNYTGSYGKAVAVREYDWGQGAPGPLLRQTKTTYLWQNDSRYLNNNFMDLSASVQVLDGAGNQMALTTYGYDESALQSSSITTQHNANPVNGLIRGNLTSVHRWLNTTNTTLSSTSAYFDTGEVQSSTDALGNSTTHTYDPAYAGAYPTQTCNALNQCVSGAYDLNTGLPTSFTDANQQTSNFSYDERWRLTQALGPVDAVSNQRPETDFNYSVLNQVERCKKQAATSGASPCSSGWVVDYAYFDGLGRTKQTRRVDPENDDFVDTTYDADGRVSTVSNPHRSAAAASDGITTTQYDALDRVTQVTVQDGSIASTDYSNYPTVTTTDEAGKLRRSRTDALGRLIEVDEPGPGGNGPGTPGAGSLSLSGSLQSSTSSGTKATGWFSVSGSDDWVLNCFDECPPHPPKLWDSGAVTITVNGTAASAGYGETSTGSSLASAIARQFTGSPVSASDPGTGTVTLTANVPGPDYSLSGSVVTNDPNDFGAGSFSVGLSGSTLSGGVYPVTTYDSGTLTVNVSGPRITTFQASASYNQNTNNTAALMAQALTNALNVSGSPVTATLSGTTINLTAKGVGAATNFTVTGSSTKSFAASSATLGGGTNPGGLYAAYVTGYSYDALGNLTQVSQAGDGSQAARVRSFTYDSLSRLLTATNPETGAIHYAYDADGNLLQRTSPAPNQGGSATETISDCYDALNRVTGKAYSAQSCGGGKLPNGTAAVSYTYDQGTNGIGHLTSLTDQAGAGSYSYDGMGRIANESRTIAGVSKSMGYSYNLDGSLQSMTYPSGRVLNYAYDTAGRPLSAVDGGAQYVTNTTYYPGGQEFQRWFPGVYFSTTLNQRLQVSAFYSDNGKVTGYYMNKSYQYNDGHNNGNVVSILNNNDHTRDQSFTYDQLNRLVSAGNAGTDCTVKLADGNTKFWGDNYGYDAWGNLLSKSVTKCSAENISLSVSALGNNQLSGYGYDAAGNMTSNATTNQSYSYDPENRITGAAGFMYTYDADGNRVEKANGSTGTIYWYMTPGIVAESDLSGNLQSEYVFFGGERVARIDLPGNTVHHFLSDHLRSTTLLVGPTGAIENESEYYPWGGERQFSNTVVNHYKFTGKERDAETNLDYFGARYYSNSLGRFITPDWAAKATAVPYAEFADPQSLNLYSYVRNVPTTRYDADGHCEQDGSCPKVTVKVNAPPTVLTNVPVGNQKLSGVGTTTTIKLTNANGTPAAGVPVKESPVTKITATIDGQTTTHTNTGTQGNPNTVTTSSKGTLGDLVMQPATNEPVGPTQDITAQDVAGVQNAVPLTEVTTQALTFPGQDCTCQATYSETLTNVGSNGQLNPVNSNTGTNFTLTVTTPTVTKKDKEPQ